MPVAVFGVGVASRVIPDIEIGAAGAAQLREAEVEQLGAALRQHDVRGLQIAMRDPRAVRLVERVGDLDRDLQRLVERQRTVRSCEARRERLALEILHHEIARALVFADVMDRADVRMIQRRNRACFAFEPRAQVGIGRQFRRQDLDRDGAIEARIAGLVDLAHAARAERRDDLEVAQANAGFEGHG